MARRRTKKRTHVGAQNGSKPITPANAISREPKSMVIRIGAGEVGPSVSQLVKDVRSMMEPGTASRLKERRSNRLRDYTAMAGPLGVSHLLLFSRSTSGNTNLRLALTPRGPTLHFRIEQYSLAKDVRKAQRHPHGGGKEYMSAPLLVMNNFNTPVSSEGSAAAVPKYLESLTTTIFQSLFPPISPQTTPLSSIRRVLLLNRELVQRQGTESAGSYILNLRHYIITTRRTGLSRGIKRLNAAEKLMKSGNKNKRGIPDLGKLDDVADYLLDPGAVASGFTSGSESEIESDAGVEVLDRGPRKVLNKKQMDAQRAKGLKVLDGERPGVEKRAVRLVETGPRMKLRMTKVEEGVCGGKVMWHEHLSKTQEEINILEQRWETRRREKEQRRRVQKENVERKQQARMPRHVKGIDSNRVEDEEMEDYEGDWDSEEFENDEQVNLREDEDAVAIG